MKHYLSFGTKCNDYRKCKLILENLFEIELEDRESAWWGKYGLFENQMFGSIKLYPNHVEDEGWHEEVRKDIQFLVDIKCFQNWNDCVERSSDTEAKFELLSHETID